MKNIILVAFSVSVMLTSCKNKEKEMVSEEPSKMEEVMATHDEIMPYMSEIGQLIRELEQETDSTSVDEKKMKLITDLKAANEDMMSWMMEFGDDFDSEEVLDGKPLTEEKMQKLEDYGSSIEKLKEDMESSMNEARSYLESQN